jgi:hypothetical protein
MMLLLPLLIIAGLAIYVMKPEERLRLFRTGLASVRHVADKAAHSQRESDPFSDALRARTPWPIVTLALVGLNAAIFLGMLLGAGAMADPATLVAWGSNVGPRK